MKMSRLGGSVARYFRFVKRQEPLISVAKLARVGIKHSFVLQPSNLSSSKIFLSFFQVYVLYTVFQMPTFDRANGKEF